MIWDYWRQTELEDGLSQDLLDRLEVVIPRLTGDGFNPAELYLRKNLTRLVAAFTPSDAFKRSEYMRKCLNRLPPATLEALCARTGVGVTARSFEERVDALAARRWADDSFSRTFVSFFDLPHHFIPEASSTRPASRHFVPPSPNNPVTITEPYRPLKDYQTQVLYDASTNLGPPRSRLIIQMPTGAGKTRTAMELLTQFLRDSPHGTAVVWLAHSEELCEQAFEAFGQVWQHVATTELRAYRAWGNHPLPQDCDTSAFIVTSFTKLYNAVKSEAQHSFNIRDHISLIVVDEAHKAVAPTYKQAIRGITTNSTRVVGLTATPGRTIEDETEELARFFFQSLVGIRAPEGQSVIQFLRDRFILARAVYDPLVTGRSYQLTASERRSLEQQFDFPAGFLKRIAADDVRNIEIMKRLIGECEAEKRVLLFATSVEQSKFFAALLMYFGFEAAHLDGQTNKIRRRELIEAFRRGTIQVLCNYGVLSTGFDAPNTDVVLIARPTASPVLYSQMIGRGLRGPAIGGTAECKLIDVRDNIIGFGNQERVYDLFDEYFV